MKDVVSKIEELTTRFKALNKGLNLDRKMQVLKKLEAESSDPDLWKDPNHARDLMQKIGDIKKQAEQVKRLEKDISDLVGLSDDKSLAADLEKEVVQVEKELEKLELTIYLSGPYDEKNAVISIHAGRGEFPDPRRIKPLMGEGGSPAIAIKALGKNSSPSPVVHPSAPK